MKFFSFALKHLTSTVIAMTGLAAHAQPQNDVLEVKSKMSESVYASHEIFEFKKAKIIKQGADKNNLTNWAIIEINGVIEGNLCGASELVIVQDSEHTSTLDEVLNLRLLGRSTAKADGSIEMGGACASFSRHSPFKLRLRFTNPYISSRPPSTLKWTLNFKDASGIKATVTLESLGNKKWSIDTDTSI